MGAGDVVKSVTNAVAQLHVTVTGLKTARVSPDLVPIDPESLRPVETSSPLRSPRHSLNSTLWEPRSWSWADYYPRRQLLRGEMDFEAPAFDIESQVFVPARERSRRSKHQSRRPPLSPSKFIGMK